MIRSLFLEKLWFFVPFILFLLGAGTTLLLTQKGELVLLMEEFHTGFWDQFFFWYTHVGDGLFAAGACLLLIFLSRKMFFSTASALLLSSGIAQFLKRVIFLDHKRPAAFFGQFDFEFHPISDLVRHFELSMPSGHSTSAFCLFAMLAFYSPKRTWGYLFFLMAFLVALSRMYLAQHFLEDVLAGAFIGVVSSTVVYLIFEKKMQGPLADKPLIKLR